VESGLAVFVTLAVSAYVGFLMVRKVALAVRSGTLTNGRTVYIRSDNPLSFYFNVGIFSAVVVVIGVSWLAMLTLALG
jgi:hypothetical protein